MAEVIDARLKLPFSCIVSGSPMSGKTSFVRALLEQRDRVLDKRVDYLVWFYGQRTDYVDRLEAQVLDIPTRVVGQLPDAGFDEYIMDGKKNGLFVIDDLMVSAGSSKLVTDLFCNKVQHANLSVLLLLQNLFYHGSERSTLVRCAHYLSVFRNPMDASVPLFLAQKIMPLRRKLFLDIFERATSQPYGYLFIDGKQETDNRLRFRTDIAGEVQRTFVVSGA